MRKQRKAEIAANRKNVLKELNEKFEAASGSPFQLVDKIKCGYLRAHEISAKCYKDP